MEFKGDKDLAIELTIAVVKARADVISSIDGENITAKKNNLNEFLSDQKITETFEKIYATLSEKE